MQEEVKNIIRKVAAESQLPVYVVEAAFKSQFVYARKAAMEGEAGNPATFKNARLKHMGTIKTTESKIIGIDKRMNAKRLREKQNGISED